jgi:hypothetical protein
MGRGCSGLCQHWEYEIFCQEKFRRQNDAVAQQLAADLQERWVLRQHCNRLSQAPQPERRNVHSIDLNPSAVQLQDAEE